MKDTAEVIKSCMVSCGWHPSEADAAIADLKREAIEADSAFEQEVGNLRNAKNDAVEALQTVLYNLRNA